METPSTDFHLHTPYASKGGLKTEDRTQMNNIRATKAFFRTQGEYRPMMTSKVKISRKPRNPKSSGLRTYRRQSFLKKLENCQLFLKLKS